MRISRRSGTGVFEGTECGADYKARISGPLLDRFDIRIEVPRVPVMELNGASHSDSSEKVARRVEQARRRADGTLRGRRADQRGLEGEALEAVAKPDSEGQYYLQEAAEKFRYTARGYHRVLRIARTLADLEGSVPVRKIHVAEAIHYRRSL